MPTLTNGRHELFAQHLAKGKSQPDAYKLAGYKPHRSSAARLAADVNICGRVAEILGRGAAKAEITVAEVLAEYRRIAFADVRKMFTPGGGLLNPTDMDDDMASAVQAVEVITRRAPGNEKTVEQVHKIKLNDKLGALNSIARHLGMFVDLSKVEHSGGVIVQINGDDAEL